ncbi:hypothetical protein [Pseudomonas typographi]|uniref:Uncharacterized protein n=1 Tax=Pseudomonas typographi TaxID=2715964 RepID=A0ABR7Z0X0_9PSED|nr:hypothetical protein [Pseudomonas typographi]MBD1552255.1 hypothetical protein [Pseudomonas typographi]MBD1587377.1 hypothetical protein [Pseudomonas typographi]MBD1599128.1 hypothetical protein [Pseudomonas typographi]
MRLDYATVEGLDITAAALDRQESSGKPVVVWVQFDGLATTRNVELVWQVASDAKVISDYRPVIQVDPTALDPAKGLKVPVPASEAVPGPNREVWLHYVADGQPSPRLQFRLGGAGPVVMARQAFGLVIVPDEITETTLQWTLPPYTAMAEGDVATLWLVSDPDTSPLPWDEEPHTVLAAEVGAPLVWQVDTTYLLFPVDILGAHVSVVHATRSGQPAQASEFAMQHYQVLMVQPADPNWLPDAELPEVQGDIVDPGDHPQGLSVRLPLPAGLTVDDAVLLHWRGADRASSQVQYWAVDAGMLQARAIDAQVPTPVLAAGVGGTARLSWQFARPGAAANSRERMLQLLAAAPLPAPTVLEANDNGEVAAARATAGLRVQVPALPGEVGNLTVHYQGHPDTDPYATSTPEGERVFRLPAQVLPPNMGANHYSVYYTATIEGRQRKSPAYQLRITPLPSSALQNVVCAQVPAGGQLSIQVLSNQHNGNATFSQRPWPFYAQGQQASIVAQGLAAAGGTLNHYIFNGVTPAAPEDLTGTLPVSFLQTLRRPQQLDVDVTVRFGGDAPALIKKTSFQLVD